MLIICVALLLSCVSPRVATANEIDPGLGASSAANCSLLCGAAYIDSVNARQRTELLESELSFHKNNLNLRTNEQHLATQDLMRQLRDLGEKMDKGFKSMDSKLESSMESMASKLEN